MTPITLYEGCFVKTADGCILGPLHAVPPIFKHIGKFNFPHSHVKWDENGRDLEPAVTMGWDDQVIHNGANVIAVYPSLSAAAAANPEM